MPTSMSPLERFLAKVDKSDTGGCWKWTASRSDSGYGFFSFQGKNVSAHRWAYEHFAGPIPAGFQLDHLCHLNDQGCVGGGLCPHRACVRPTHLQVVTGKENVSRIVPQARARMGAKDRGKTHCPHGHAYTPENTYVHVKASGYLNRVCRTCKRANAATRAAKTRKPDRTYRSGYVAASRKAWPGDLAKARALMDRGTSLRQAALAIGLSHTQLRRRLLGLP